MNMYFNNVLGRRGVPLTKHFFTFLQIKRNECDEVMPLPRSLSKRSDLRSRNKFNWNVTCLLAESKSFEEKNKK